MLTQIIDVHKVNHVRPAFDLYIGRAVPYTEFTKNSIWHNPFRTREMGKIPVVIDLYEAYIRRKIAEDPVKYDLRTLVGKRLGCWCLTTTKELPRRCHGQVLLTLIREVRLE